jgi:hypothetical protein
VYVRISPCSATFASAREWREKIIAYKRSNSPSPSVRARRDSKRAHRRLNTDFASGEMFFGNIGLPGDNVYSLSGFAWLLVPDNWCSNSDFLGVGMIVPHWEKKHRQRRNGCALHWQNSGTLAIGRQVVP